MKVFRWAARALMRAPLRGTLLVGVLGVSVGLALIMITVNGAFAERLDDIRAEVGTTVTVRPAGSFGGGFFISRPIDGDQGSGTVEEPSDQPEQATLTDQDADTIASIEHVESYSRQITAQFTGEGIESSIGSPSGVQVPDDFSPPVLVTGTDDATTLTTLGVETAEVIDGRGWTEDESHANVALVGQQLAEKNQFVVGDTFQMDDETFEVVGIYSTGTQFGDNNVFMPLDTARAFFERGDEVDLVSVNVDTASHVGEVADAIRDALGEDVADVTSDEAQFASISAPVSDAQSSSEVAMIAALIASAAIILFSVAIVARQRIKEIGIFKAIGASNWHVVSQMTLETAMIAVVAAVIGAAATFPLAQSVADGLVSEPAAATVTGPGGDVFEVPAGPRGATITNVIGGSADTGVLGDIEVAVSPEIFLYALGIAIGLALLATIIPAWYVGRVKPAEVLRYE